MAAGTPGRRGGSRSRAQPGACGWARGTRDTWVGSRVRSKKVLPPTIVSNRCTLVPYLVPIGLAERRPRARPQEATRPSPRRVACLPRLRGRGRRARHCARDATAAAGPREVPQRLRAGAGVPGFHERTHVSSAATHLPVPSHSGHPPSGRLMRPSSPPRTGTALGSAPRRRAPRCERRGGQTSTARSCC